MDELARPLWETDEDRLDARVKQLENQNRLAEELLKVANDLARATLSELASKADQIAQLTADLELRTRERDQAIAVGWISADEQSLITSGDNVHAGSKYPDLFAHLAGRGE